MKEVWIGLVRVRPRPKSDILEFDKGAYVNVLAFASNETDYLAQVKKALKQYALTLEETEDVEPFSQRKTKYELSKELYRLAQETSATQEVRVGVFHTFPLDDSEGH